MVGFMRRYDDAYRAMKDALNDGQIGAPLLYYSGHRNPAVPPSVTTDGVLVDTCVHDIDTSRWLFDAEVVSAEVLQPPPVAAWPRSTCRTRSCCCSRLSNGMLVDIEAAVNIAYGYDIRGEVLGETGTIELAESGPIVVKREGGFGGRVPSDWRERFIRAYDIEFQEWIDAAAAGRSTGPSSWDGYAATVVCDAARRGEPHGPEGAGARCASARTSTSDADGGPTAPTDGSATMVKIALDPAMYHADLSVADEVRKAAELGYEYLELSPAPGLVLLAPLPQGRRRRHRRGPQGVRGDRRVGADPGAGVQLVLPRRAGAAGAGPQLAAAAGDRRRSSTARSSTPSCPATRTTRCGPSTPSTSRWRS